MHSQKSHIRYRKYLWNYKTDQHKISGQYLDNVQYCDVITNPRWRTAVILKIAKSSYLSEKSSDFDKMWYITADIEPYDSHVTKNWNF